MVINLEGSFRSVRNGQHGLMVGDLEPFPVCGDYKGWKSLSLFPGTGHWPQEVYALSRSLEGAQGGYCTKPCFLIWVTGKGLTSFLFVEKHPHKETYFFVNQSEVNIKLICY